MSIQSEIDRLTAARESIGSAITAKGVTVPVDARLDDMAELIKDISVGGSVASVTVRNDASKDIVVYIADKSHTVSAGGQAAGLATPVGTLIVVTGEGAIGAGSSTCTVLGQEIESAFSMTVLSVASSSAEVTAYDANQGGGHT